MGNKIQENFSLVKYGVHVRLANEYDSDFILSLRSDNLASVLHTTGNTLEKQIQWMRNYKEREKDGKEYYFIYDVDGKPFGLNRIYDVKSDEATTGSWVTKADTDPKYSIASLLILKDIYFDILGFTINKFDVRKVNKQVIKLHKWMGAEIVSEDDEVFFWELTKEKYHLSKNKILKMFNL